MKSCILCKAEKPLNEFSVHKATKDGRNSYCKECQRTYSKEWYAKKVAASPKKSPAAPKGRRCTAKEYYERNAESCRQRALKYYRENVDVQKAKQRDRQKSSRAARAAYESTRRGLIFEVTPKWNDRKLIVEIYELASARTKMTGIPWHVDHIVPLKSKRVCGLHTEANLRVIPLHDNVRKGNRHWPDMPE